ncbi:hypothetical protein GCM10010358_38510 [Streptomyces minutiscleroticus]|uniref:Uncharacterized protein n=1 Tax=Streptomyces minutiscleroticus TaxID=68238 RepID=A0A918NMB8_9ACTN|nr:hypothetical protein GCM10010358_38510 [Streptomyces minutiscleroticus]
MWLHHTVRADPSGARDALTPVVPCACGAGYVDILLDTEDDLLETLAELRPTGGRSLHDAGLLDCRSIRMADPRDGGLQGGPGRPEQKAQAQAAAPGAAVLRHETPALPSMPGSPERGQTKDGKARGAPHRYGSRRCASFVSPPQGARREIQPCPPLASGGTVLLEGRRAVGHRVQRSGRATGKKKTKPADRPLHSAPCAPHVRPWTTGGTLRAPRCALAARPRPPERGLSGSRGCDLQGVP